MSVERQSLGIGPAMAAGTTMTERRLWESPETYLFGGLAAMLALITIALLIIACSYWRRLEHDNEQELEKGDAINSTKTAAVYEEKIVVIMPGSDEPSYLAHPVPHRLVIVPSLGANTIHESCSSSSTSSISNKDNDLNIV